MSLGDHFRSDEPGYRSEDQSEADDVTEHGSYARVLDPITESMSKGEYRESYEEDVGGKAGQKDEHSAREAIDEGGSD